MLTAYIKAAMKRAKYEWIEEDDLFYHYAEILELPGTYGCASKRAKCEDDLRAAIIDRIAISLEEGIAIPEIDGQLIEASSNEVDRFLREHVYVHSMMTRKDRIIQLPNLEEIPGALVERIVKAAGITEEKWESVK